MKTEFPQGLPDAETTIEISPRAVAQWHKLPKNERPLLIDCREADELLICRIDGHDDAKEAWFPPGGGVLRGDGTSVGTVVRTRGGGRVDTNPVRTDQRVQEDQ